MRGIGRARRRPSPAPHTGGTAIGFDVPAEFGIALFIVTST
jgi:hypothetical protein